MGEDIGRVGGLFRATEGLYEAYGAERVRDTPLTESGFVGCGIGAALTGLRPVVELQFSDFSGVAFDQIMNQAAKLRFMMGGNVTLPMVIRMVSGGGVRLGAQHSQSLEALFSHIPGLVVVMPSNPFDAKGLLAAAIQDDNPVIFLEQKLLFFDEPTPVPEERYAIELGRGRIVQEGTDVTVVALGATVPLAVKAARELEREGVSVEIVDPRTLVPLDMELIAASLAKTSRLVVVHEAVQFLGFGSEIAAHVAEHCFWDLDAPIVRVGAPSHPIPYQRDLELATLPARRTSPPRCGRSRPLESPKMAKLRSERWFGGSDLSGLHPPRVDPCRGDLPGGADGQAGDRDLQPVVRGRQLQPPLPWARRGGSARRPPRGRSSARVPDDLAQREPDEADHDAATGT